ncbi:acetoacetate--CoA ligase [Fodinicola acaciae]|uniref:acetoacetate--CoA ligase n=1 Tax=Fodinicola acaciae TaxID=2681555 RepID=UPI0013D2C59C|nr:acetoacetate--CoA ligase [Fodinicola acaciae]
MPEEPEVLWRPDPERADRSRLAEFTRWVRDNRGVDLPDPVGGYAALHEWSVTDLEGFWGAAVEFFDVRFHAAPSRVLADDSMPGAKWFPGATLNYAEHALRDVPGRDPGDVAVVFRREDGKSAELTLAELRSRVAAARAGLVELGVGKGDRVVALSPNSPETLVAFLAAASLGVVWSSCSPDFGPRAIFDRFAQIEPVVLFAVNGYCYGGNTFDATPTVQRLRDEIPSLRATVLVDYVDGPSLDGTLAWDDFLAGGAGDELAFEAVDFDHPLWVLYSSGTTGLPKGIVQGHGGILVEHLKVLTMHCDLGPGSRFFWFTTTGWMMWNFLISGLLVGSTIVLFDGNPGFPDLGVLWRLAAEARVDFFGTSAPFVQSCLKKGLRPRDDVDLTGIRALGSTGSPLSTEGFRWIADAVGEHVQICSTSGGTDLCTAFIGAAPTVPVWMGEMSCASLGSAAYAYDEAGKPVVGEVGELVVTRPMPSMPVFFWNDPDGTRLREAYFEMYPGKWRHGDWFMVTDRGSCVIFGRSDSTLNRGGVRMGTAEFYRVVEGFDEVLDSLVIDTTRLGGESEGELLCFLVLAPGADLEELKPKVKAALRTELSPRHVPDSFVVVDDVPRTLNGKKCEVPVKKILAGTPAEKAVSRDALANPAALDTFVAFAR